MKQDKLYENIRFERTINTINQDFFPASFPPHWHKYVEIICYPTSANTEQNIDITIENQIYSLSPGDSLIVWPGELHTISNNTEKELVGIQFSYHHFHELSELSPYLHAFRNYHIISHNTTVELAEHLEGFILHMLSLRKKQEDFCDIQVLITLFELLMTLGKYVKSHPSSENSPTQLSETEQKMQEACTYIMEHCDQTLTLDNIAGEMGFSSPYFSRTFKKFTNCSFVEYLTTQRVKHAQMLLADYTLSITDICYLSGFKSISSFNRAFSQNKGCSPSEYRKLYDKE